MPAITGLPEIVFISVISIPGGGAFGRPDTVVIVTSPEARTVYGAAVGDAVNRPMHEAIRDCVERVRGTRPTGQISEDPDCIRILQACRSLVFNTDDPEDGGPVAACKREVSALLESLPIESKLEPALRDWVDARNRAHAN